MKKALVLVLFFVLSLSWTSVRVYAAPKSKDIDDSYVIQKNVNSSYLYEQVLRAVVPDVSDNELPSFKDYAGAYISREGDLVYCFASDTGLNAAQSKIMGLYRSNKLVSNKINSAIRYEKKEYSYYELDEIKTYLDSNMMDFKIKAMGIVQEENHIWIKVDSLSTANRIINLLNDRFSCFEENMLFFEYNEEETSELHEYAHGGDHMVRYEGWFNSYTCTLGFNAYNTVTNVKGVITAGHCVPDNAEIYNKNGYRIGTEYRRNFGGDVDAAFVAFENSSNVTWATSPNVSYTIGANYYLEPFSNHVNITTVLEGSYIFKAGFSTNFTGGYVQVKSFSWTVDGTYFVNLLLYSNNSASGDSGGPLWVLRGESVPYTNKEIAGLHMGREAYQNSYSSVGCKINRILANMQAMPITSANYQYYQ